jgi:hypothetical protein
LSPPDLALNSIFTLEMVLRMMALGGVFSYLSHPWNLFDAVMVFAGYTVFIPMGEDSSGMQGVRALRAMRALRPLRTITRWVPWTVLWSRGANVHSDAQS